jgi:hypothetical protein
MTRPKVSTRVLSQRELNRALLARQLLLERATVGVPRALERIAGIQAQYAPSAYVGLWSRLEGFSHGTLTRALERRSAVQGTLMRSTIHLVARGDYWAFAAGTRSARQESQLRADPQAVDGIDLDGLAGLVRAEVRGRVRHRDELLELVRAHAPARSARIWNALSAWVELVRAPPSGTWERRRADLYRLAEDWVGPPDAAPEEGAERLLRRYLGGFGPARLADAASWAGLPVSALQPAADRLRLRRFRAEDGAELLDLPRAPLPNGNVPAPVRFLPTWDSTLLAHARRTQILPERFRTLVFSTKTPHSTPTFTVDGAVAGSWKVERSGKRAVLVLQAFERLPQEARRNVRAEAERTVRFVEPDATSYAVRG